MSPPHSHVTPLPLLCDLKNCDMTQVCQFYEGKGVTWLYVCGMNMCDMRDAILWHDSRVSCSWWQRRGITPSFVRYVAFICVWLDSSIRVTWVVRVTWLICVSQVSRVPPSWWQRCAMTHPIYVTWRIGICDMTHSYVRHDSFVCAKRLVHTCYITHLYVWHESVCDLHDGKCVTWLIHTCDMTHWYVRHDSIMRATCFIGMRQVTQSYVGHNSFICGTWVRCVTLMMAKVWQRCDMTHPDMRHDSIIRATWLTRMSQKTLFICAAWLIRTCNMTHPHMRHDSIICATWLIHMCNMTHSHMRHD